MPSGLRGWIPPNIVEWRSKRSHNIEIYNRLEQAVGACGAGYLDNDIVSVVVEKTKTFRGTLEVEPPVLDVGALRILAATGLAGSRDPLRVLDFGGAAGQHYFVANRLMRRRQLDWRVVETSAMVAAAQSVVDPQLSFFESIRDATATWSEPPDLVFASGVLMFLADPMATLHDLMRTEARILFITRTGFTTDSAAIYAVQFSQLSANGPGSLPSGYVDRLVAYPSTFLPLSVTEQALTAGNYVVVARFEEERNIWQAPGAAIHQYGFLCRRLECYSRD